MYIVPKPLILLLSLAMLTGCASQSWVDRYRFANVTNGMTNGFAVCAQDDNGQALMPDKNGDYSVPHGIGFNSGYMADGKCQITRRDYRPK